MKSKKLEIEIPEGKTAVWRNGILTLIDEPEKDVRNGILFYLREAERYEWIKTKCFKGDKPNIYSATAKGRKMADARD